MKKMTMVFSREGLSYECFYCKTPLAADEADNHSCDS